MRRFLFALLLMAGVLFLLTHLAEVEQVAATLQRGSLAFVGLAIVMQAVWLVNVAASYRSIYRLLGVEEELWRLFFLASSANFINVVTPSGMVGGVALFVSEARQKGYSPAKAALAGVLFILFEYAGFFVVLILGLIVLVRRNDLTASEIVAAGLLFLLTITLLLLLFLGLRSAQTLGRTLAGMARAINFIVHPFIRRNYLDEQDAHHFAAEAAEGLALIRGNIRGLAWPLALSLSSKAILIIVMFLVFVAFKTPYSTGTLIGGFTIAYLFTIISPTPSGIGVVEGLLAVGLHSLNVELGAAAVITVAYRGVTFWLPLLWGIIAFRIWGRRTILPVGGEA